MSFSKLKLRYPAVIAAFSMLLFVTACNDSDKSEKNSTTSDTAAKSATTTTPGKKVGKASAKLMAAEQNSKIEKDKEGYYMYTEVLPVYPGGQDALQSYVSDHLQYPEDAIDNNIEGTVRVQFAIDEQGNVTNAKVVGDKLGYGLEEEAVKLITSMPKWTPGMVKGKKVKAWYTLPVTYRLEGS